MKTNQVEAILNRDEVEGFLTSYERGALYRVVRMLHCIEQMGHQSKALTELVIVLSGEPAP